MKKPFMVIPIVLLCCFAVGCLQREEVESESTASLEQDLRSSYTRQMDALNNRDIDTFLVGFNRRGFGYRTMALRTANDFPNRSMKQVIEEWFETMKYFKVEPKELDVAVDGNIGLIWGFFVEEFQEKGKQPERNVVRFSETRRRTVDGYWETLISHKDIQPFDVNGRYIPNYKETE